MKQRIIVAAALVLGLSFELLGCGGGMEDPGVVEELNQSLDQEITFKTFSVATFNIHGGVDGANVYDLSKTVAEIVRANADVVLLQEVHNRFFNGVSNCESQPAILQIRLGWLYPYQTFQATQAGTRFLGPCGMFQRYEAGLMILSKTPLTGTQGVPGVQKAITTLGPFTFSIYNTHYPLDDAGKLAMAQREASFINSSRVGEAFAGGDFNAESYLPVLDPLRNAGLTIGALPGQGFIDLVFGPRPGHWIGAFDHYHASDHFLMLYRWGWYCVGNTCTPN